MDYKHCCVINAAGYYQTFVLVLLEPQEDGTVENKVQGYDLLTGEQLIEATPPTGFVKAHWTGAAWEEGATADELAAWEKDHPAPDSVAVKSSRSTAIKAACAKAIIGGFDTDVLGRGSLHYTLTEIQQRDLQTQYAAIQAGATSALWHDASRVTHEVYTEAQFTALFQAGYAHIIGCKIRSDWLEQLAHDLADAGKIVEAAAVDWDTTLPESYQTQCDAQTMAMLGGTSNGTSA